jgi:hypothetical protein
MYIVRKVMYDKHVPQTFAAVVTFFSVFQPCMHWKLMNTNCGYSCEMTSELVGQMNQFVLQCVKANTSM